MSLSLVQINYYPKFSIVHMQSSKGRLLTRECCESGPHALIPTRAGHNPSRLTEAS